MARHAPEIPMLCGADALIYLNGWARSSLLIGDAYRGADGQSVIVLRDAQHSLPGGLVAHLLSQNADFHRALMPVNGIVDEMNNGGLDHDDL